MGVFAASKTRRKFALSCSMDLMGIFIGRASVFEIFSLSPENELTFSKRAKRFASDIMGLVRKSNMPSAYKLLLYSFLPLVYPVISVYSFIPRASGSIARAKVKGGQPCLVPLLI